MPRVLPLVAGGLSVLALASAGAPAGVAAVSVTSSGFAPRALTVHAGDTVTWTNTGTNQHQVVSDRAAFPSSPVLQPGQSYSFTFRPKGRFAYHDDVHPALKGLVVVTAPGPTVTIGSAARRVVFGGRGLTLSGRVSSHTAGQTVEVMSRACGTFGAERASVRTRRGGFWRLGAAPQRTTVYGATWKRALSSTFKVGVAPRLRLVARPGGLVAEVSAAMPFTGRTIRLERFNGATNAWVPFALGRLEAAGQDRSGTMFATAPFRATGGEVRASLSAAQAAPCYVAATSNTLGP